jgi:hypothetical protein
MYARVVRFTGADAAGIEQNLASIRDNPAPPEGVESSRFLFLADRANGTAVAISFHDTEDQMRASDRVLNEMSPDTPMGTRASVDLTEVELDLTP